MKIEKEKTIKIFLNFLKYKLYLLYKRILLKT